MSIVDNAIYVDGRRKLAPTSLDTAFSALRSCSDDVVISQDGGVRWVCQKGGRVTYWEQE